LSARWRRNRKHPKKFNISRALDRVKDKNIPKTFRTNPWINKQTHPYRYRGPTPYRKRKFREPEPLIDVLEERDEIAVVAELAGFQRENIRIQVKNQRLTLSAEALGHKYYKSLNLPKRVIPSNMCTTYKNGVLEIRLKKAAEEKVMGKVAG